jgi:hypothetical protein
MRWHRDLPAQRVANQPRDRDAALIGSMSHMRDEVRRRSKVDQSIHVTPHSENVVEAIL